MKKFLYRRGKDRFENGCIFFNLHVKRWLKFFGNITGAYLCFSSDLCEANLNRFLSVESAQEHVSLQDGGKKVSMLKKIIFAYCVSFILVSRPADVLTISHSYAKHFCHSSPVKQLHWLKLAIKEKIKTNAFLHTTFIEFVSNRMKMSINILDLLVFVGAYLYEGVYSVFTTSGPDTCCHSNVRSETCAFCFHKVYLQCRWFQNSFTSTAVVPGGCRDEGSECLKMMQHVWKTRELESFKV